MAESARDNTLALIEIPLEHTHAQKGNSIFILFLQPEARTPKCNVKVLAVQSGSLSVGFDAFMRTARRNNFAQSERSSEECEPDSPPVQ